MRLLKHVWLVLCLFAVTNPALAASIRPLQLEKEQAILLVGEITLEDVDKFKNVAASIPKGFVFLESDGGSVFAAIEIGKMVRQKGYGTAVINDSSCNSACGLIWLAGTPRALSKSGRVGFHAAYSDDSDGQHESGVANAIVGRYLTLLKLPERAVIFATVAPPSDLSWLTTSNFQTIGVDLVVINDVQLDSRNSPKASNKSRLWRSVGDWGIYVDPTLDDSCFLATKFATETALRVGIASPGNYYVVLANPAWKSLHEGMSYDLRFKFDDESPWSAPVKVIELGRMPMLMAKFSNTKFWGEFAQARRLVVSRGTKNVASLPMDGSGAAFAELVRCQKEQWRDD